MFESWTAADLEKIFWDVRDWKRAILQDHPNASLVGDLEERIAAEYTRRRQDDPLRVGNRQAAEIINSLLSGRGTAERPPPRLTLVRRDDEPGPDS